MSARRLRAELEGRFWQATAPLRRLLRRLRRELAILRHRLARRGLVVFDPPADHERPGAPVRWQAMPVAGHPKGATAPAPSLDLLRLVGELEDLAFVAAPGGALLLRLPEPDPGAAVGPVLGRFVDPGTAPASPGRVGESSPLPWRTVAGRAAIDADAARFVRRRARRPALESPSAAAAELPPTAVLLLPFLAIGGSERLLLDYARAAHGRRRLLLVTTEPHRPELGSLREELARFAELLPLGDTLERTLHAEALTAIVRRSGATALVAWNGCALFYESAPRLRAELPQLRLVNQIYDHRVGWIRRITPELRRAVDLTIAVNRPIADELVLGRGLAPERVALVRHGVALREPATAAARRALRRELGIPDDAVVAASFLRLHPQKRPLDLVAVARRLQAEGLWLLLVGGGPLDAELDAELARRPAANVVRRALDPDPSRYFAAADLCLMASQYEGLPVFLLEGMSHGLPAVATAVGEIPELLAAGAGGVAPPGDVERLTAETRALLDPERRRVAGLAARRTVAEGFSLASYVAGTDAAIFPGAVR